MDMNTSVALPPDIDDADDAGDAGAAVAAQQPYPARPETSIDHLGDVPVTVQVVLGSTHMRIDDLLRTGPGSVVELERRVGEPVDVLVNDRLIARGQLVMAGEALGVTLTEVVRQER